MSTSPHSQAGGSSTGADPPPIVENGTPPMREDGKSPKDSGGTPGSIKADDQPRQGVVQSIAEKGELLLPTREEQEAVETPKSPPPEPLLPAALSPASAGGTGSSGLSPAGSAPAAAEERPAEDGAAAQATYGARPGEFVVVLERPTQGRSPLGLQVIPTTNSQLSVAKVSDGLVMEWNRANPQYDVKASNIITEINGHRDADAMLNQIRAERKLVLHLKRTAAARSFEQ